MRYHIGLAVGHTYSHGLHSSGSSVPEAEGHTEDDSEPGEPSGVESGNDAPSLPEGSISGGSEATGSSTDEDYSGDDFWGDDQEESEGGCSHHSEGSDDEYLANEEMYGS